MAVDREDAYATAPKVHPCHLPSWLVAHHPILTYPCPSTGKFKVDDEAFPLMTSDGALRSTSEEEFRAHVLAFEDLLAQYYVDATFLQEIHWTEKFPAKYIPRRWLAWMGLGSHRENASQIHPEGEDEVEGEGEGEGEDEKMRQGRGMRSGYIFESIRVEEKGLP